MLCGGRLPVFRRIFYVLLAFNIVVILLSALFLKLYKQREKGGDFCERYKVNGDWPIWPYNMHNVSTSSDRRVSVVDSLPASKGFQSGERQPGSDMGIERNKRTNITYSTECTEEPVLYSIYCDKDCRRFRRLLDAWPKGKPKAVIYFLIDINDIKLMDALRRLDQFFNDEYRYPVVIFADKEVKTEKRLEAIRSMTNSTIFIQTVAFDIRIHRAEWEIPEIACFKSIGYRHMCRFQAKAVYEQPILEGVDYAWRLDDDSELLARVGYDVFEFMLSRNLTYGYYARITDRADCVAYLWESTCRYVSEQRIRTEYFTQWRPTYMYYNNFEISALSLWRSCAYGNFINYIDRLGGIYYYRWGDAPIKSIALSLMTPLSQIHHFNDIAYQHQGLRNS